MTYELHRKEDIDRVREAGLTLAELEAIQELPLSQNDYLFHFACAVIAKMKEKQLPILDAGKSVEVVEIQHRDACGDLDPEVFTYYAVKENV